VALVKILQTERLTLRWFTDDDAPFVLELLNEPSWIRNIGDRGVRTVDQARAWIADKLVAGYWQKGLGLWAVERRSDGALVGMCGLLERDELPDIDVGYALVPRFWGQGYAREATAACLAYAREVLGRRRVLAIVQPENTASIRVLETIGLARVGVHRGGGDAADLALFVVGDEAPADDAATAIALLVGRFYAAFSNRRGLARIASVPSLFLPGATVTVVRGVAVETMGMRDFLLPRAALLLDGRLTGFEEREISGSTEVRGALAHHASRYEKTGLLDGAPLTGGGEKDFQLVRSARGWKIAALMWEDA
jgi:RimJ/RimL family protein N-acetyltransferase